MNSGHAKKHRMSNLLHSILLLTAMASCLCFLGWVLLGASGLKWVLVIGGFMVALGPRIPPHVILKWYRARPLFPREAPRLFATLEKLSRRASLFAAPKLYYIPSRVLGAFTVGNGKEASIAVTDGLLSSLNSRELIGVMAHEVAHAKNNDLWLKNLSNIINQLTSLFSLTGQFLLLMNLPLILFAGYEIPWLPILALVFTPLLILVLELALSRTREFEADLGAASLTGDPAGLAAALAKIGRYSGPNLRGIFIPGRGIPNPSLFRTHPNTEERVKRLLSLVDRRGLQPAFGNAFGGPLSRGF